MASPAFTEQKQTNKYNKLMLLCVGS